MGGFEIHLVQVDPELLEVFEMWGCRSKMNLHMITKGRSVFLDVVEVLDINSRIEIERCFG